MAPHRIDVHHHVIPDTYLRAMSRAGVDQPIPGVAYPRWSVEADLDTAMSANGPALAALTELVDTDHILFGTDYPFMPESTTAETVAGVRAFFGADTDTVLDVERNNAAALLPRLARLTV